MESNNFIHQGQDDYPTDHRESHWQPALRPDTSEPQTSEVESTVPLAKPPAEQATADAQKEPFQGSQHLSKSYSWERDSEEDENENQKLDPAWGFKRSDSIHLLDAAQRSPSFPNVEFSSLSAAPVETLPHSQVEDIAQTMEKEEVEPMNTMAIIDDDEHLEKTETDTNGIAREPVAEADNTTFVSNEIDGRFSEGLPLIPPAQPFETPALENEPPESGFFAATAADDEASFFSSLKTMSQPPVAAAPALDRKTTSDVLNAMDFKDGVTESPPPEVDFEQMLAHGDANLSEISHVEDAPETSNVADAMWAAAFDDDEEFLVEDPDDLLPDSEPGSPSSFSALLHEGDDAQNPAAFTQVNQKASTQAPSRPDMVHRTSNPYAPHQPSTSELTQLSPRSQGNVGLARSVLPPMGTFQSQLQQQEAAAKAASFVDKSKGGYQSPYDLPMDIAPKRRPQALRQEPQIKAVAPPPRSSSMTSDKQLQSPFSPTAPNPLGQIPPTPPTQKISSPTQHISSAPSQSRPAGNRAPSSSFFEELPVVQKTRSSAAPGRYTPSQSNSVAPPPPPPAAPPQLPVQSPPVLGQPPQSKGQDAYSQFQLRPPERLDPYANVPLQPPSAPSAPLAAPATVPAPSTTRYSPAPPPSQNGIRPSPSPRYSPAPPPAAGQSTGRYASQPLPPQPMNMTMTFQPRTSSPLAHHRSSVDEQAANTVPVSMKPTASAVLPPPTNNVPPLPPTQPLGSYSPSRTSESGALGGIAPPRRSQTQSPGQQANKAPLPMRTNLPANRPASAFGQISPIKPQSKQDLMSPPRPTVRARAAVEELDFVRPQDDTQYDPLERWKGAPIFNFGFGGQTINCFPRHTPRYGAGSTRPQIKATSGEVLIRKLSDIAQLPEHVATFPGPLRGKSKKKEILSWISTYITKMESQGTQPVYDSSRTMPDPRQQHDEKILLWKTVKVLLENDGNIDTAQALQAINSVLVPEVHAVDEATATQYRNDEHLSGIYRPAGTIVQSETSDPQAVEALRKHLLKGKREDAVWHAVDNRLWSHAMLIASTLERPIWKQVTQEFVRQEVKTIGNNSESLCALYAIFGGNLEESIDQLVPPSARAGLQMIRRADTGGSTKNALEGLNRWKETLTLVLNNRTGEDQRALATLARLLSDYGRTEAAHLCYLFARSSTVPTIFGGADDPQTSIVLLGADHVHRPFDFYKDIDAILLTEVFEFANSLSAANAAPPMPHLAVYKLQRANDLAEVGMKTEAQAYCEAIASGLRSSTKQSLYYHPLLLGEVEDLSNRLKQVPVQSSSWMAKPSIEKVSGSVWNKLNNFITGDESDDSKSARDSAEAGPFAGVSGSPGISRSGSQTDLQIAYPTAPSAPTTTAGSRYAPNGLHSTRSSSELNRGRPSFDRSPPSTSHSNDARSLYTPALHQPAYSPLGMSPPVNSYMPNTQTPPQSSYVPSVAPNVSQGMSPQPTGYVPHPAQAPQQPTPPQQESYLSSVSRETANSYTPHQESYVPSVSSETANAYAPNQESYMPSVSNETSNTYVSNFGSSMDASQQSQAAEYSHMQAELEPVVEETSTYEPSQPAYGGYVPPEDTGYQPYVPEPDSENEADKKSKSKKKSFMDKDDDTFATASRNASPAVNSTQISGNDNGSKKANDEAADAAFRAAAEADAKRAKEEEGKKSGWLGGWFGGKKKDSLDPTPAKPADGKPAQIKFGESKMKLYYDKDLKRWINPDNPEASQPKATPPPPRSSAGTPGALGAGPPMGGPPRAVSTPLQPPQRMGTPADGDTSAHGTSNIGSTLPPSVNQSLGFGTSGTTGPPSSAPTPNPPSRPSSGMSAAAGLDDLLGGPPTGARKGAAKSSKAKKGRYVDVMAK